MVIGKRHIQSRHFQFVDSAIFAGRPVLRVSASNDAEVRTRGRTEYSRQITLDQSIQCQVRNATSRRGATKDELVPLLPDI